MNSHPRALLEEDAQLVWRAVSTTKGGVGALHLGVVEFEVSQVVDTARPHEVVPCEPVDEAEEVAQLMGQDVAGDIEAIDEGTIRECPAELVLDGQLRSKTGGQRLAGSVLPESDALHQDWIRHPLAEVEDLVGTGELDEVPADVE